MPEENEERVSEASDEGEVRKTHCIDVSILILLTTYTISARLDQSKDLLRVLTPRTDS